MLARHVAPRLALSSSSSSLIRISRPAGRISQLSSYQARSMSSSTPEPENTAPTTAEDQHQQQQQQQQTPPKPTPLLPGPDSAEQATAGSAPASQSIDMSGGGGTLRLDHLGPLVVNLDGTMSRIANWAEMADVERENTLRILGRRNKQRLEALKAKKAAVEEAAAAAEGGKE
jgi:hypothetical protein